MEERARDRAEAEAAGAGGEESPHRLEAQRRSNREVIRAAGGAPYGRRRDGLVSVAEARRRYDPAAEAAYQRKVAEAKASGGEGGDWEDGRPVVSVAGRVVLKRDGGKLQWLQVRDWTSAGAADLGEGGEGTRGLVADLQVAVSARDCAGIGFAIARGLDLGDVVVATGPLVKTKTGEVTVWARGLEMGAKSLAPPPEKWRGLTDIEARYRRRYVDLSANPGTMRVMRLRSGIMSRVRRYLDERGFLEVETPVLQSLAGGAAARPFKTHMNALDIDLFMRIAPELYLKRLLVGGMPRVYEMSRNFRNEGLDKSHNPEFTSLEVYEAFGDYETMMELAEGLIRDAARFIAGGGNLEAVGGVLAGAAGVEDGLRLAFGEVMVDYGSRFARVTYAAHFERALGFSMGDVGRARAEAKRRGLRHDGLADILVVNELFEEVAEGRLDPGKPTFVIDYPSSLSPLTRPRTDDPEFAERFDLFIGGMEIGPAYTELNDPDVQESKFREQLRGIDSEESTFRTFDEDFVRALKVGMPPAGGLGLGMDRLCMLLLNQRTIRDVILFPMMKPEM